MDLSKIKAKSNYVDVSFCNEKGHEVLRAELEIMNFRATREDRDAIASRLAACWNNFVGYQTVNPPVETEDAT